MKRLIDYFTTCFYICLIIFLYFIFLPILSFFDYLRIQFFGPQLSKQLVKDTEERWEKEHPGWPKEYMGCGLTLMCDGEDWWYKDGKWQIKSQKFGSTTFVRTTFLPDGSQLHYEEWTNKAGQIESREWKIPAELLAKLKS